jgi:hypothetical protein
MTKMCKNEEKKKTLMKWCSVIFTGAFGLKAAWCLYMAGLAIKEKNEF